MQNHYFFYCMSVCSKAGVSVCIVVCLDLMNQLWLDKQNIYLFLCSGLRVNLGYC